MFICIHDPWSIVLLSPLSWEVHFLAICNLSHLMHDAWYFLRVRYEADNDTFFLKYKLRNSLHLKSGHEIILKPILYIDRKHMNLQYSLYWLRIDSNVNDVTMHFRNPHKHWYRTKTNSVHVSLINCCDISYYVVL